MQKSIDLIHVIKENLKYEMPKNYQCKHRNVQGGCVILG